MRRWTASAALVAVGLALGTGQAFAANILLSNDDGYDAPGIVALQAALKAAGHKVTTVAPSGNRSGSSAALTFTPFAVSKKASDVYALDTLPATTVLFGVTELLERAPDLIVSGINTGANIGPSTVISGTVGNIVAGLTQLDDPIPGIAFSTNLVEAGDPNSAANVKHFQDVAKFAARLVTRMEKTGSLEKLGPHLGLNVNYPALAPRKVKGVTLAVQGFALNYPPAFTKTGPDTWVSSPTPVVPTRDIKNSDVILFNRGFVTVVPIDADYTAKSSVFNGLRPVIAGLAP